MAFGDFERHGHSDIFSFGVNQSGPRSSSTTNHILYRALDDLMVHGVNDPWIGSNQRFDMLAKLVWVLEK